MAKKKKSKKRKATIIKWSMGIATAILGYFFTVSLYNYFSGKYPSGLIALISGIILLLLVTLTIVSRKKIEKAIG